MKGKHNDNWSLFRLSDRKQFDRVDIATIDFFYRALPEAVYADWLMWREGFSGWRPFAELPMILKHLKKDEPAELPPPIPEAILKLAEDVTGSGLHRSLQSTTSHATSAQLTVEGELKLELPDLGQGPLGDGSVDRSGDRPKTQVNPDATRLVQAVSESDPSEDSDAANDFTPTHNTVSNRAITAAARSGHRSGASSAIRTGGAASSDPDQGSRFEKPEKMKANMKVEELPSDEPKAEVRVLSMPDEATLSLMLESQAATEDRNNVRYNKRFKIRIFTPKGIIPMTTIDCSISGFKLKEPLPEGLPRFFHVEIDLGPEGKIPLICSEIREKDGRAATRVRIQVNDHVQAFRSALMRAS